MTGAISFCQNATYPSNAGGFGTNSVYVGHDAGISTDAASSFNTIVGYKAGDSGTNGVGKNTLIGAYAGQQNDGEANTYIGDSAGKNSLTSNNTYIGLQSGALNSNGSGNVFLGYISGRNSTGSHNTFLGSASGILSTGSSNVGVGDSSGYRAGLRNVFIGNGAGTYAASYNVMIGYNAGREIAGNNNIIIGHEAASSSAFASKSNMLYIDVSNQTKPLILGDFSTDQLQLNGRVGIGYNGFSGFPGLSGTPNVSTYSLFVDGGILTEEVRIRLRSAWPDYVFNEDYKIISLSETEAFIKVNGHLPNMPSAETVKNEGIEMGEITRLQQEKIEELTLHLIKQEKEIEELKAQVQLLLKQ